MKKKEAKEIFLRTIDEVRNNFKINFQPKADANTVIRVRPYFIFAIAFCPMT